MSDCMIFSGNANPSMALGICRTLDLTLGKMTLSRFSDGEMFVEILENVRGQDVFVLQPTCHPTNDHIMELLLIVDALRRASAGRITAVVPYFGYARQDRRPNSARVPISAKVVADLFTTAGVDRVVTVDLHADQIQGFFSIPVDNLYASPLYIEDIQAQPFEEPVIVSPDVGGVLRARAYAKRLGCELAIIDKRRPKPNQSVAMQIIGEVQGRACIIIDDMIDTAGTLCAASNALKAQGAKTVMAYATHAILSGQAVETIENSTLDTLVVSDTIPLSAAAQKCKKIRVISLVGLLSEAIRRVSEEESISSMFQR